MVELADDVISPAQAVTLHGLFLERVRRTPGKTAYRYFRQNAWHDLTWQQMHAEVARWQTALSGLGLQRGDRVAIMLRSCPVWIAFDQAAMSLGLVTVPLYTVDRPDNIAYIVNDSDARVLLFETAEQWQALRTVRDRIGGVARFISIDTMRDGPRLTPVVDFLPKTAEYRPGIEGLPDDLASIVYTSGTTGRPKGVMLSHANVLSNAYACLATFAVSGDDLFLSFLPLSHTFERTLGYYLTVMTGATVAFARSISQLSDDLKIIRPTLLISVPRIYERIYAAIRTKLEAGPRVNRRIFHLAVETGWARFEYQQGRGSWHASFLLWPLLHKLVAQKLIEKLGGRLRVAISGGAALSPEISRVFVGLGLPVVQGYGLTETSPVITGNHLENNFPDSVGQPIADVRVRLGAQGVLLVKGPNVMLGYWNNPEATRAIIDQDGWLDTGDVAHISDTGHVYITGRIKEIIVMSNGEKIPPNDMELAILHDPLFDQVMIFGEAHPYLVAVAVLNPEVWVHFATEVGIRSDMPEALTDSRIEAKVLRRVARNLRGFPGYARVNRVLLLREPWSIDNGLLTPTLKLKRDEVTRRYAPQIRQLYEGH
ncbi:MAG: AMP-dependent synthetase/ligase [Gallionella sp.]|nr:AMP-dependent synthetase/ligase [Gallionella sp.]